MPEPTLGQVILTITAAGCFLVSVLISMFKASLRGYVLSFAVAGTVFSSVALVWHAVQRRSWLPLDDNFDAILWIAILTAIVSLYLQRQKMIGRIDWVLSPIVALLLLSAAFFGTVMPHSYTHTLWATLHRVSVFTGPIFLALAAACGVMYLILSARLRNKHSPVDSRFGSLERLEHLNYTAVSIGFALLTVGLITGVVRVVESSTRFGEHWFLNPKIVLSVAAYVLYALVLHSPINPSFRGRRTAILSIAGFVLLLGTLGLVQVIR
ncbi:MAG: hypothetical protein KatS3mg104_1034 [Phycisphaerae bacterium]|jgi:ABC-type uncharacterized transport system permease subunit|nr:MAG: hypothetical protein KatS3mg104_1034 [Phycisphaerae bacterium]